MAANTNWWNRSTASIYRTEPNDKMDLPPCYVRTRDGQVREVDIDDEGRVVLPPGVAPAAVVEFFSEDSATPTLTLQGFENLRSVVATISFTAVNLIDCPALAELELGDEVVELRVLDCPALTTLDLSDSEGLELLDCRNNQSLTTLRLPQGLRVLNCANCPALTTLDLGPESMIRHLTCLGCPALEVIDLAGCQRLKTMRLTEDTSGDSSTG